MLLYTGKLFVNSSSHICTENTVNSLENRPCRPLKPAPEIKIITVKILMHAQYV